MEFLHDSLCQTSTLAAPRIVSGSIKSGIGIEIDVQFDWIERKSKPESHQNPPINAKFDAEYDGKRVGTAQIQAIWPLIPGPNNRMILFSLFPPTNDPAAVSATQKLVSEFGAGRKLVLCLTNGGLAESSSSKDSPESLLLSKVLKSVTIQLDLMAPESATRVVNQVSGILPPNFWQMTIHGRITLANPFDCTVNVLRIVGDCLYNGSAIGHVDAQFSQGDVVLEGRQSSSGCIVETPAVIIALNVNFEVIQSLMQMVSSGNPSVAGVTTVTCSFGGYEIAFDYSQAEIPLVLQLW
ncbi:hypothetical protein HK100_011758 [Physocladia obscura]|uniref:Uncharacterized protein n=1 Tax=Physocladia obscura TaxID=109957 RepID=A0AAD5XDX8_9FUNG|nr:hypothetical protein HK100_011758 [Physocladia obscura]